MNKRPVADRPVLKAFRRRIVNVEPSSDENSNVEALEPEDQCGRCNVSVCICTDSAATSSSSSASGAPLVDPSNLPSTSSNLRSSTPSYVSDIVHAISRSRCSRPTLVIEVQRTLREPITRQDQSSQTDEPSASSCQAPPSSSAQNVMEQNSASESRTLHSDLLSILECPVCLDYIAPPINQCRRGHLVCQRCKSELASCPTCRERFTETRNLAMEKVAERLKYPCKYAAAGCIVQSLLIDKHSHESNCSFRSYSCVFRPCTWNGLLWELTVHLSMHHPSHLLLGERQEIHVALGSPSSFSMDWMINCHDELFHFNVFQNSTRRQLGALVEYVGPYAKASNYVYTLELVRCTANQPTRKLSYCRTTHIHVPLLAPITLGSDCLTLSIDAVDHFASNGEIVFKVHIQKC